MKIFLSSVIVGFEKYRDAAAEAVETLGHTVLRAETWQANSSNPRAACLDGVRQADLTLLILGDRYGTRQSSGISATHEEFREAQDCSEILAFVLRGTEPDTDQREFRKEVQDWQDGVFTAEFETADELRRAVTRALHEHLLRLEQSGANDAEALERAISQAKVDGGRHYSGGGSLVVALVGTDKRALLRPRDLEGQKFADDLLDVLFGMRPSFLLRADGTEARFAENALSLSQKNRSLALYADGSLRLRLSLSESSFGAIIEEDMQEKVALALKTAHDVLQFVDPTRRIGRVCVAVDLDGRTVMGWRTREEEQRNPHQMTVKSRHPDKPVHLDPACVPRGALKTQATQIAEDLTVLLRRQFSSF